MIVSFCGLDRLVMREKTAQKAAKAAKERRMGVCGCACGCKKCIGGQIPSNYGSKRCSCNDSKAHKAMERRGRIESNTRIAKQQAADRRKKPGIIDAVVDAFLK